MARKQFRGDGRSFFRPSGRLPARFPAFTELARGIFSRPEAYQAGGFAAGQLFLGAERKMEGRGR